MATVKLTKLEARALLDTSGQMEDDMEYYKFMTKKQYKEFVAAYQSARDKLRVAVREKGRDAS